MTRTLCTAVVVLLFLAATAARAGVSREEILILNPDARSYTVYKTLRSDIAKRALFLAPGETPDDFIYIHPSDYGSQATANGLRLIFDQGGYAFMRAARFADWQLTANADGSVTFHSWNGQQLKNGHYGKWNAPDPFQYFSYIWVLPTGVQVLDYQCNRQGQWNQQGRTLSWSGSGVNDITFRITFAQRAPQPLQLTPAPAPPALADAERITLDAAVLFPPGSSELAPAGQQLLAQLAGRLTAHPPAQIIVAGYTDNQPLKPYLRERYPSNWELSAARATGVVRFLIEQGIAAGVLQARAFGAQHPLADNDSPAGRAKNRRIEITIRRNEAADQPNAPEPETTAATSQTDGESVEAATNTIDGPPPSAAD